MMGWAAFAKLRNILKYICIQPEEETSHAYFTVIAYGAETYTLTDQAKLGAGQTKRKRVC